MTPTMDGPMLDFTGAIDSALERLNAAGHVAVALSMSKQRKSQLAAVMTCRGATIDHSYRGLPIRTALKQQQMVAIIDNQGQAHLA